MRSPITLALMAVGLGLSLTACSTTAEKAPDAAASAPAPLNATEKAQIAKASAEYEKFIQDELAGLVRQTGEFVAAVKAGRDDEARAIYPNARTRWERVEPIAAEFGDLDPAIDGREAGLQEGEEWTGWHRIEKDLWPARAESYTPLTDAEQVELGDKLLADTKTIQKQGKDLELTATDIVEGSQGLLEEIAGDKITGEEEYWSRTDLWDFQANLDGAWKGYELLEPVIGGRDAQLAAKISDQFGAVQDLLDATKTTVGAPPASGASGGEFVAYDKLTKQQIKAMSDAVNALGESMAEVSAVL